MTILSIILLIFSIIFVCISLAIKRKVQGIKKRYVIQDGVICYSDLYHPEKSLTSSSLPLTGKPDYIIKTKQNEYIPIEVKTGDHHKPKRSHVMQLVSYCHLVEETYGKKIPYGILVYYDTKRQFKIPYSTDRKLYLTQTISKMIDHMKDNSVSRNHNHKEKCLHCSMREVCPEKIQ